VKIEKCFENREKKLFILINSIILLKNKNGNLLILLWKIPQYGIIGLEVESCPGWGDLVFYGNSKDYGETKLEKEQNQQI
jgi:hypothetical protein